MTPRMLSSSSIEGTNVTNPQGENIGTIKDLMIDWEHGRVGYAVLSFGGFLGMGDKYFAFPLEAFEFNTDHVDGQIVLNIDKERLKNAPGFDKDNWPQNADRTFMNDVYAFSKSETYW